MIGGILNVNRLLVFLAIIIFIVNFVVSPMFLNEAPNSYGTFIGLILLSIALISLIDQVNEK
jgi:protein-S-isoprenylcysteine O-methyltransferase Ste14